MSRIAFVAEVAPLSVNRAYAPAKWGKRHGFRKTPEAEAYAAALKGAVPLASMLSGPLRVTVTFYWPTEAGDVDGPIKLTLDALQGAVYENDRQVKEIRARRVKDAARPRVAVEVEEMAPDAAKAEDELKRAERIALRSILGPKPLAKLNRGRMASSVKRYGATEGT